MDNCRFIPYRKNDLIDMLLEADCTAIDEPSFRQLCHMLASVFHYDFHQLIEATKNSYAPIDPDADTRHYPNRQQTADNSFIVLLRDLLEKANYEQVSEADLNDALSAESLFNIRLHIDFNDFDEVLLFCRGESIREQRVTSLFGLRTRLVRFSNYERVVVYIRFKDSDNSIDDNATSGGADHPQKSHSPIKRGATLLKLFQDVPKADLEMLFPNTKVGMRTIDKLLIGVPAVVSGAIVLTTKLGASAVLLASLLGFWLGLSSQPVELNRAAVTALVAGLAAFAAYLWKQFSSFKNRKLQFMQTLTQNLYFKNLDNNAGVFHRLANDAEEEEGKEAILAYYFLLFSDKPLTPVELDSAIEQWFLERWDCAIDFEIDDAIKKLHKLQLIEHHQGRLEALSIEQCQKNLDRRWDNIFVL